MAFLPLLITLNLVGYTGKDAKADLNWYAPQFTDVGSTTTDINAIQLTDTEGNVGWGDVLQIAGPLGPATAVYMYYDKSMHPSGEGTQNYWGDDVCNPVNVSFDKADGFAFDNPNAYEYEIVNSGEVIAGDVSFEAEQNLNWFGNPFPVAININAIQLTDTEGMVGWGDVLQVAGPLGPATAVYMYYDKSMHPSGEGTQNYWGDDVCNPVDVTFNPGDAFAIDNPNGYVFDINIKCPYSL